MNPMMKTKFSLIVLAAATLAACSQTPVARPAVQQLDTTTVWSTGNYR